MPQVHISADDIARLRSSSNIRLATVRANGSPHLIPIWFVWLDDKAFICTSLESVKAKNIRANPNVAFSLEDGSDPIVIEAQARQLEMIPPNVAQAFREKYDWNIINDPTYDGLIELTPTRLIL